MTSSATKSLDLVLASASPRRYELLQQLGLNAKVIVADIDESALEGELASDYVCRLACTKAKKVAVLNNESLPILAGDTIVVLDGQLLGKPNSEQDAINMWQTLSGRTHQVYSALAVSHNGEVNHALSATDVTFSTFTDAAMRRYWQTGEPCDKAGAYAIQGYAASWVKSIHGSYSGVMGLPLYECAKLLRTVGIKTLL